jgi:hypothetical protein
VGIVPLRVFDAQLPAFQTSRAGLPKTVRPHRGCVSRHMNLPTGLDSIALIARVGRATYRRLQNDVAVEGHSLICERTSGRSAGRR